ncbi:hypothetical protein [Sphingomonas sp. SAFR-052]|uniref:hypothetical protein n=1 Tax=Sphingomonas sp. SAFR-052 TaxID=3436867 RepID=UPI003F7F1ABF
MLTIVRRSLDLDRNVLKVLLFRLWTILAGIVTIIAIPRFLNGESQGYYYTFLSIVALQALFDLGLSQTIAQISSHEFAYVDLNRINDTGFTPHIAKLSYIKATVTRWYRWVGGAFVMIVTLVGVAYFALFGEKVDEHWLGPWIALVVTTGINLILSPRLAIVEGAGWTGTVAGVRLVQSMAGYMLLVIALAAGAGLWSAMMVPFAANLVSLAWLRGRTNPYRAIPSYPATGHNHAPWRAEILGLQWRVAIAWLGGYFASQVIVPVVFALQGAEPAGRIGLGLQAFGAVQALGMSWISARVPRFGQFIARGDHRELKAQFVRAAASATGVSVVVAVAVVVVLAVARDEGMFPVRRIPSVPATVLLAVNAVLGTIIYAMAAYMRAHKEEPLVLSSLVIGSVTLLAAIVGARLGGDAVVLAYACVTLLLNLPWTVVIFSRYYRRDTRGLL